MDINLKSHRKVEVSTLIPGQTCRLIDKMKAFLIVDMTKIDMFKNIKDESDLVLRDDVIYCVDMESGVLTVIPKNQKVYLINMVAEEVMENK